MSASWGHCFQTIYYNSHSYKLLLTTIFQSIPQCFGRLIYFKGSRENQLGGAWNLFEMRNPSWDVHCDISCKFQVSSLFSYCTETIGNKWLKKQKMKTVCSNDKYMCFRVLKYLKYGGPEMQNSTTFQKTIELIQNIVHLVEQHTRHWPSDHTYWSMRALANSC